MIAEGSLNLYNKYYDYSYYSLWYLNLFLLFLLVTISQTYKNIEKDTIEALYKFPIYEAAAICGFEAEIDGQRKVKGIVKEAKKAAEEYTEAVEVISHLKQFQNII